MYTVVMALADDIQRKLDDAGVKVVCLACGGKEWSIDPTPAALFRVDGRTVDLDDAQVVRAITVVCTNCGFIRLHKASHVGID
jgi:hypothetical protein